MSDKITVKSIVESAAKAAKEAQEIDKEARKEGNSTLDETKKKSIFEDANMARNAVFSKAFKNLPHHTHPVEARKAIGEFLRDLVKHDTAKLKDLSDGTDANGGYLTPLEFSGMLVELLYKLPVIRPQATVLPMNSDKMEVPIEASTVSANWTAELGTITQSDPTFSNVTLAVNNLIGISRMSRQLLLDAAINYNLVDWIMQRFAKGIARAEDTAFMAGSGSGQPKGIRQYTFTNRTVAQAGAHLAYSDLVAVYHTLPFQYRTQGNPVWLINDAKLKTIRNLVDSNGQPLYQDGYGQAFQTPGGVPMLMGFPVLVQNDIPTNLGAGTNASEIYFGDLSYYVIGEREQVFSEVSTEEGTSFAQHRAAVKVGERIDGQLTTVDGIAQLTGVID